MQRHAQREQQRAQEQLSESQRLQERMARMRREHEADTQRFNERIGRLPEPMQQVDREVQEVANLPIVVNLPTVANPPMISIAAVQHHMQRIMEQQFTPLERHVSAYAQQSFNQSTQVREQERQRLVQLEQDIALAENQMGQITRKNEELQTEEERLQQNIEQLELNQEQLDRNIQQLHAIITRNQQRRKRRLQQNIRAVVCVALSAVATWGLACLEIPLSINLATQGVGVSVGYASQVIINITNITNITQILQIVGVKE